MIELLFKSKRIVDIPTPPPVIYKKGKLDAIEYTKRDAIVRQFAEECSFKRGDTCYPSSASGYANYGACIIVGIAQTYKDYGDVKWIENNPMIVTFAPLKNKTEHIFCTTNYLVSKNPHITC